MNAENRVINSFLELLKKQPYSKISIDQIMLAAGISRTYFYQLFDNKDDLAEAALYSIIDKILQKFTSSFTAASKTSLHYPSITAGITLIRERQHELQNLLQVHHGQFNLNRRFQNMLAKAVHDALIQRYPDNIDLDYAVSIFVTASTETIHWTINHPDVPNHQIVEMVADFTNHGILNMLNHH